MEEEDLSFSSSCSLPLCVTLSRNECPKAAGPLVSPYSPSASAAGLSVAATPTNKFSKKAARAVNLLHPSPSAAMNKAVLSNVGPYLDDMPGEDWPDEQQPPDEEEIPMQSYDTTAIKLAKATRALTDVVEEPAATSRENLLTQQLALEQRQFERLKHDFTYNLSLLRERDAELERYDVETAALRSELEVRGQALAAARRELGERDAQLAEEKRKLQARRVEVQTCEKRIRELSDTVERREADAKRIDADLEVARKQRQEALAAASRNKAAADEQRQDATSVRTEVQLRLQQMQQERDEMETSHQNVLAEERAQRAAEVKALRAEARRDASALQEQIDKLQVELGEANRQREAAHDEVRGMREALTSDQARRERLRDDAKRAASALSESQAEVLRLVKRNEQIELAARHAHMEHKAQLEALSEERTREAQAAQRTFDERVSALHRLREEEVLAERRAGHARAAELDEALGKVNARIQGHAADLAAAEERGRNHAVRAEQLLAQKQTLLREVGSLKADAVSSRERADVLQKMLTQRTEYIRKLQLAAARREEQLTQHFMEAQKRSLEAVQEQLEAQTARSQDLARQLEELGQMYEVSERQRHQWAAALQGTAAGVTPTLPVPRLPERSSSTAGTSQRIAEVASALEDAVCRLSCQTSARASPTPLPLVTSEADTRAALATSRAEQAEAAAAAAQQAAMAAEALAMAAEASAEARTVEAERRASEAEQRAREAAVAAAEQRAREAIMVTMEPYPLHPIAIDPITAEPHPIHPIVAAVPFDAYPNLSASLESPDEASPDLASILQAQESAFHESAFHTGLPEAPRVVAPVLEAFPQSAFTQSPFAQPSPAIPPQSTFAPPQPPPLGTFPYSPFGAAGPPRQTEGGPTEGGLDKFLTEGLAAKEGLGSPSAPEPARAAKTPLTAVPGKPSAPIFFTAPPPRKQKSPEAVPKMPSLI